MAASDPDNKRYQGLLRLLTAVFLAAVLVAAFYGLYSWQQNKIDKLDRQVAELTAQLGAAKQPSEQPGDAFTYTSQHGVKLKVYWPVSNAKVASPVVVVGQVPGNWSFEASFPVQLKDSKGNVVAQAPAQLLGDWMTDQPVPFLVKLEYSSAEIGNGKLLLIKDNPSGLPANDDSVSIPVEL